MAKLLLDHGARTTGLVCPEEGDLAGYGVLHLCTRMNYSHLMERILDSNPGLLFVSAAVHPIHLAVLRDNRECLQLMLEKREKYWAEFVQTGSILNMGINDNQGLELVKTSYTGKQRYALLSPEELPNVPIQFPAALDWYLRSGVKSETLEALGVVTPLHCAAFKSRVDAAELLFLHGASIHSIGGPPSATAISLAYDAQMIELLTKHGATLNQYDDCGRLYSRRFRGETDIVSARSDTDYNRYIKDKKILPTPPTAPSRDHCQVDLLGNTTASEAVKFSEVLLLQETLNGTRELTQPNQAGTLLIHDCLNAAPNVVTYILNSGLDLGGVHPDFGSALHSNWNRPRRYTDANILRLLLRRLGRETSKRLLNFKPKYRHTPLYFAAGAGQLHIAKVMLSWGAEPDLEGGPFGTPLMAAATYGRLEVVKILVWAGAAVCYYSPELEKCVSAYSAAKLFPEIQWWLLVERWKEQKRIDWLD